MVDLTELPGFIAAQDWAAAERLLRKAARARNPPPEVYYNLAKVLEAAGKPGQMAQWLKRALTANPAYAFAWFELGRLALNEARLEAAFHPFTKAHELAPGDDDSRRNLGRIALRLGKWDVASSCFGGVDDPEALLARYRIAAETGTATQAMRAALFAQPGLRKAVLKTLTRTAKGSIPLDPDQFLRA
jgi:tetratricopeptide (TPR) repeat protein